MPEEDVYMQSRHTKHDPTDIHNWENVNAKVSTITGRDPGVSDDIYAGYDITSLIIRTDVSPRKAWIMVNPEPGNAIWERIDANGISGGGSADLTAFELMSMFKTAILSCEAIPTRNEEGRLSRWDVWDNTLHTTKLFTQIREFTDGRVTRKLTTDEVSGATFEILTTITDGKSTKIVRNFTP